MPLNLSRVLCLWGRHPFCIHSTTVSCRYVKHSFLEDIFSHFSLTPWGNPCFGSGREVYMPTSVLPCSLRAAIVQFEFSQAKKKRVRKVAAGIHGLLNTRESTAASSIINTRYWKSFAIDIYAPELQKFTRDLGENRFQTQHSRRCTWGHTWSLTGELTEDCSILGALEERNGLVDCFSPQHSDITTDRDYERPGKGRLLRTLWLWQC